MWFMVTWVLPMSCWPTLVLQCHVIFDLFQIIFWSWDLFEFFSGVPVDKIVNQLIGLAASFKCGMPFRGQSRNSYIGFCQGQFRMQGLWLWTGSCAGGRHYRTLDFSNRNHFSHATWAHQNWWEAAHQESGYLCHGDSSLWTCAWRYSISWPESPASGPPCGKGYQTWIAPSQRQVDKDLSCLHWDWCSSKASCGGGLTHALWVKCFNHVVPNVAPKTSDHVRSLLVMRIFCIGEV